MGIYERQKIELFCTGCGHLFAMGDTINLFHLGLINADFCNLCKDKIISYIHTISGKEIAYIS